MDAVSLLERQHAQMKNLFDELRKAVESERADLLGMLADELTVHMTLEEQLFYPAVASLRSRTQAGDALDEHHKLRARLVELVRIPGGDVDFPSKLTLLEGEFLRHAGEENAELFPVARERLAPEELRRLGARMKALADELHGEEDLHGRLLDEVPAPGRDPGERERLPL